MTKPTLPHPPALAVLDSAIAEWYEALESGRTPLRREWLDRYPHLSAELNAFFDDHENFERLKSTLLAPPSPEGSTLLPEGDDRYAIDSELARGGMAVVLRAEERGMKRQVAMKVLPHGSSPAAERRFIEEARLMGRLEHPNIVPVHELGTNAEGQLFFSMKLLQGRSLKEVLDALRSEKNSADDASSLARLLRAFLDVCNAIAFAHSKGVIHRDLKPSNIMLGDFGEVLVMDWGLAKMAGASESHASIPARGEGARDATNPVDATQAGTVLGTPLYMPPEQAAGRVAEIDARSDVYSLGAILYEILSLEPPHEAGPLPVLLMRVMQGRIDPPEQRAPARALKIPKELSAIAMKALARAPDARYQSVADLRRDVELFLEGHAVSAKEDSAMETIMKLIQRNKGVSIVTAIFTVLLCGVTAFGVSRNIQARMLEQEARKQADIARAQADAARVEAEKALVAYQQAEAQRAAMARNSVSAFITAARVAIDQRRLDDALAQISVAVQYAPDNTVARMLKGEILIALNKRRDGTPDLEEYTKLKPTDKDGARLAQLAATSKEEDKEATDELIDIFLRQKEYVFAEAIAKDAARLFELWQNRLDASYPAIRPDMAHPGIGFMLHRTKDGELELSLNQPTNPPINDLAPLRGIPLNILEINGGTFSDLTPLQDMPLKVLRIPSSQVTELGPLQGMKLRELDIALTSVRRLTPIQGMPIEVLRISKSFPGHGPGHSEDIDNIEIVRGMPLRVLKIDGTNVKDLSPVEGAKLEELDLASTQVSDISVLRGMPMRVLQMANTQFKDISALQGAPLKDIGMWLSQVTDISALKGAPLERVFAANCSIKDIAPLKGAPIRDFWFESSNAVFTDLEVLRGMPLRTVAINAPKLKDISALQGMNLRDLYLNGSPVEDFSPLEGMQLQTFACSPKSIKKGIEALKNMKTLTGMKMDIVQSGWMTPEQFWRNWDRLQRGEPLVEPAAPPPPPEPIKIPKAPDSGPVKPPRPDQF